MTDMLDHSATPGTGALSFGSHRFKASLDRVAPAGRAGLLDERGACALGVSLGSVNFEGARLEASIEWISATFSRCAIVAGDTVYRLTLALLNGTPEDEARSQALAAGRAFAGAYAPLFRQYADRCEFTFLPFSAIETAASFPKYLAQMRCLADEDAAFAASVEAFADLYLSRGDKLDTNPFAVSPVQARAIAKAYLLEESALFAVLREQGWPTVVYPGSIDSIEALCEERYSGAPEPLSQLTFASLSLRKRGLFFADGAAKVVRMSNDAGLTAPSASSEFLGDLDDASWARLLKAMKLQKYAPREPIIKAGDADRRLCLLIEGRAEVTAQRADGTRQQIAIIEEGTVIGEQSFLDGLPRSAQVAALSECSVRTLSPKDFRTLKAADPALALDLISDLGRIVSLRSRRMLFEMQNLP